MGTWIGWYFQERSNMKFPLWIILGCFISTFVAFYHLYVSMKNDDKPSK
jgi:abortive infection bacteriophage resistance protein